MLRSRLVWGIFEKEMKKGFLTLAILLLCGQWIMAQRATVTAGFDSVAMMIGDQTKLTVTATCDEKEQLFFPMVEDSLLEVVEFLGYDTVKGQGREVKISANYLVTCWDSALVYIDKLPVIGEQDTFWSNPLTLKVVDVEVDTAMAICDIKPVVNPPFDWRIFWTALVIVLLVAALTVGGIWAYRKYFKNRKTEDGEEEEVKDLRPAHVVAFEQLEELKSEKLWQEGKVKTYYSRLTDIVKGYIAKRYGISAMEQTSDDLLRELRTNTKVDIQKESVDTLKEMLQLSDLVKFAKWNPLPPENEKAFEESKDFIYRTKKEETIENDVR